MKLKAQNGAAAVEFAIVAILLFVLLFGIIEFSIALYDNSKVADAVRAGARIGANYNVDPNTGLYQHVPSVDNTAPIDVCRVVQQAMAEAITFGTVPTLDCGSASTNKIQVTYCSDPNNCATTAIAETSVDTAGPGTPVYIEVVVRYTYDYLVIPAFIPGLSNNIQLTRRARMRLERGV